MNTTWKEELANMDCFKKRPHSSDEYDELIEQQKQYITDAVNQGKATAEEYLCFLLGFDYPWAREGCYQLFKGFEDCINPKTVYEAFVKGKDSYSVMDFAVYFKGKLTKENLDPNELFKESLYGEKGEVLGEFCAYHLPISVFSSNKDFDANAAAKELYDAVMKESGGERYFWGEIMECDLLPNVTDFKFLAEDLKKALKTGEERVLSNFATLVKRGAMPIEEAKALVDKLKEENPQMYEDLQEDGYADFNLE